MQQSGLYHRKTRDNMRKRRERDREKNNTNK